MRILYGVVGEGMGHAMRSSVILEHLTRRGHDVRIVVSGRAAKYLEARHPGKVTEITGLTMRYEDNVVRKLKTAFDNLRSLKDVPDNFRAAAKMREEFPAEVVVSDFESWSYFYARGFGIPLISVDNMQIIARCFHEEDVLGHNLSAFLLAKGIVKAKLPRANAYLITTFFFPPIKKERTTLHPPILRDSILAAKDRERVGEHVLVYQSAAGNERLLQVLSKVDAPFRVYGVRRELREEQTEGNLTLCPFSEERFIEDLATARAVVAGGGFTLMGEAIFLGKPMLSVPLVGQFEQVLNAAYLAKLGYGEITEEIDAARLRSFLEHTESYRENLRGFEHDQNRGLFERLEEALVDATEEGPRF